MAFRFHFTGEDLARTRVAGAMAAMAELNVAVRVLREGCTTGDVAAAVRISAASASEHATVLRAAGLVTTLRDRNTAIHTATAAGLTLLAAATG
ncbi:winged helix-turn-helix domain-containing protein [Kitasatospora sp. NPDC057518]|uniref:helix-turn-helix domain-containing protein n=1 Tax=Kitasatospora sp. NPDC057518 TaxID=3346155 RepID=UPI0036C2EBC9